MSKVGAVFDDTRDRFGRQRFIPYTIEEFYRKRGRVKWLEDHDVLNVKLV